MTSEISGQSGDHGREGLLASVFVGLADTLVDDYDVVELLDRLVSSTVMLLDLTAAGLLLQDQRGNLSVVATSNEETRLLEVFQLQNDEGPCLDCVRMSTTVMSDDLAGDVVRWPAFVPKALQAGFRSVVAVPMRLRADTIGGLNLFQAGDRPMSSTDRQIAQALADVATIGILQQRTAHRSSLLAEQLQHALNSRIAIEQAKGVLAERKNVGMDAAFAALRSYSRNHNIKLSDLAHAVVRGDIDPDVAGPS